MTSRFVSKPLCMCTTTAVHVQPFPSPARPVLFSNCNKKKMTVVRVNDEFQYLLDYLQDDEDNLSNTNSVCQSITFATNGAFNIHHIRLLLPYRPQSPIKINIFPSWLVVYLLVQPINVYIYIFVPVHTHVWIDCFMMIGLESPRIG